MQSIDVWWNATQLFLTDFKPPANSSFDFILENQVNYLMLSPKTFVSILNSTNLTESERDALIAGAPFDARNESTARIFYTVADYDESFWYYNFILFYSWNGCSNQAVAFGANGTNVVSNYLMCPTGVHEADIERVSVLVCKSDLQAKQVAYSQHSWVELRDCTAGNCPTDPETGNPVTYAGLEGHGNYPVSSPLDVYAYQEAEFRGKASFDNLGGVYISDRTLADPYKRWVPRPDNLVFVPTPQEIVEQVRRAMRVTGVYRTFLMLYLLRMSYELMLCCL